MKTVQIVALVIAFAAAVALGAYQRHLNQVIHDQAEYIELGCQGRYQGAE